MELNKKITILLLLLIMFFALVIRLPFLNVPLERDEGEYAYITQRIEHGEIPYKDAVCQKPPLIFCIYLLIFKIFGRNVSDIHLFMYIYTLIEILLIYKLGMMLFNKQVGLISALIFSIITMEPGVFGGTANTEIFMLLPIIASIIILLLALRKRKSGLFFICGVLNGIAFMIKQVAAFNLLFVIILLWYEFLKSERKKSIKELLNSCFYLLSGFIAMLIPIFLYFWIKGSWNNFFYWVFLHNFGYIDNLSGNSFLLFTYWAGNILKGDWFFWLFWIYPFGYLLKTKTTNSLILIGWFIFSFLGVATGLRFFPHYFLQLAPSIALADGLGLWIIIQSLNSSKNSFLRKLIFIIILCSAIIISLIPNYKYLLVYSPQQISRKLYKKQPFVEAEVIANYINHNSSPLDTIAILGSEPEILFYAKRKSATRYIIFYPLTGNYRDALIKQKETVQEIIKNRPEFILAINLISSVGIRSYTEKYIFEKMHEIIKNNYYLDGFVLIEKEYSQYIFGKEQVKLSYKYLLAGSAPVMIYRRKEE